MRFLWVAAYIAALGVLSHFVGEALPRRWFDPGRFPYAQWKIERSGMLYRRLRVHSWKDKMPDMSKIAPDMVKKRISLTDGSGAVYRVAVETCVAEAVHFVLMALAFPICLIMPDGNGLALAIIYALSHLPFIIIQRYNRPTLLRLSQRLKQREERMQYAHTDTLGQHR